MKTIYHLAISRLKYNKGRSLLTIVAITLMTTLLMSIGSSALTIIRHQQLEIAENARNYHAAFKGTTTDQIFILENHTDVESLSTRESVASIELPKLNAFLNFDSIRKGSIDQIQLADGKMPAEVDEIAGPPALFERLGVVPKIGQRFQLPLRIQGGKVENFDFTITGILEQADISKLNVNETRLVYGAFVSEKFVEQHIAPEDRAYTAYIRIVNENKHSKDEIETIISEIAEDVGLNKSDISFNEQYLTYMTNPGTQERNVMIGLGLVVVFLGGMVIYSIYYVSVISNIQEMGKLKALGATKKHIRRLLFTESLAQSFIGIPCGILLGYLATVFLFRIVILSDSTLEDTFWHWQAAICVIVVVLLTVGVSIRKPLKMASGISPVEAMRYQEPTGKQKRKKSYKTLSVSKLSWATIQRNKRRTVVTILALGCSGILFLAVANIANNISIDPVTLIKIPLIQYLYGIKSMRQTIKEIEVNMAYRWFLGLELYDPVPHFSTFGKNYTRRFKDTDLFEQIFQRILEECYRFKLVDSTEIFVDATHVKARANNRKMQKRIAKQEALFYADMLRQDINADREAHGKKPLKDKDDNNKPGSGGNDKFEDYTDDVPSDEKTIKCSTTDPESGWFRKGEHKHVFAYGIETACDKNGWIIDFTVNPGNEHDSRTFKGLYDKLADIGMKYCIVDAGYKTPAIAKLLLDDGIKPVFPYKRPMTKDGFFRKSEYVYDEYNDAYICPGNHFLHYSTTNRDGYREYKSCGQICEKCEYLSQCTESKNHVKVVTRHVWEDYMETCEDIRHTEGMKELYSHRKETIERIFGTAKENHGFRYTQLYGKARMTMKVALTFACMNLKKLAKCKQEWGLRMA